MYAHLNRLIRAHDLDMIFLAGPGHGAPGVIAPVYLEGTYSEVYPEVSEDAEGIKQLFRRFSFPGGIGSHCTPELPGSIHEGGELGYSLSHATGAAFDNPDLIVAVAVGDGEAETGPLATSWHAGKFLNPIRDGAVLPILHLNDYKINNPTLLARIPRAELESLLRGYGWIPRFVEGEEAMAMHQAMAAALEGCLADIRAIQAEARASGIARRGYWPMIVLRSPKGWTGPKDVGGHRVEGSWRAPIASVNLLITSTVWRQDHNGFTHQDPGFLDLVVNKRPSVTRIYLPPDANCLLVTADHCLKSRNDVNVIVCDKQNHLQYLDMDAAIRHCTKGIGIWDWASNDQGTEPDLVMAACGDIPTQEALAATVLLREHFPELRIRFVNLVDLFRMTQPAEHPHGLSDRDFDSLFTTDRPILFNFHGYPWLIHRLSYRRTNHRNLHVRGYKERGHINTPLELAIENEIDRFSLAIDAIDRVPALRTRGAHRINTDMIHNTGAGPAHARRPRQGNAARPPHRLRPLRPPARHRPAGACGLAVAVLRYSCGPVIAGTYSVPTLPARLRRGTCNGIACS